MRGQRIPVYWEDEVSRIQVGSAAVGWGKTTALKEWAETTMARMVPPSGYHTDIVNPFYNEAEEREYVEFCKQAEAAYEDAKRAHAPFPHVFTETAKLAKEKKVALSTSQEVADIIKARLKEKEVNRRLAWIEAQGDDTWADGAILTFKKKDGSGKLDTYVAIKKDTYWYAVSDAGHAKRYCWSDFLLFLSEDNPEPTLTELRQITVEVQSEPAPENTKA